MEKTVSNSTAMAPGKVVSISTGRSMGNDSGVGPRPAISTSLADNETGRASLAESRRAPESKTSTHVSSIEKNKSETKPMVEEVSQQDIAKEQKNEEKLSNIASFADHLVEKAKEDGVDAAFEELAKDENPYDDKTEKPIKDDEAEYTETKGPGLKDEQKLQVEEEDEVERDVEIEQDPIHAQIEFLHARVESLAAENKEFKIKLDSITEANKQALMTAYEVAMLLKKMIEQEEDEKKKRSLFEMLVNIMSKMLVLIMVGEEEAEKIGKDGNGEQSQVEKMVA